jgi:hypothetical protein
MEDVNEADQFQDRVKKPGEASTTLKLTPAYYCVPVQKRRDGYQERTLLHASDHLAIYTIKPSAILQSKLTVTTADQFGTLKLEITDPRTDPQNGEQLLGVPSKRSQ